MLIRSAKNPILVAEPHLSWCSKKVYNCATYQDGSQYVLLFRAVGDDWISRLGLATSSDGETFTIFPSPVLEPSEDWEVKGCEDPRMVKIDDTYYVTYTAFDGTTARASITSSKDLHTWGQRYRLFPDWDHQQRENLPSDWSKAAAIFPEPINGSYYLMFGDNHIWTALSYDLIGWTILDTPALGARPGHFDSAYVEMGPPPIRTDRGWLVLYHGINTFDNQRVYALGAALFNLDNPAELLWRCDEPILTPSEPYEVLGMIDIVDGGFGALQNMQMSDLAQLAVEQRLPKAVFCCGSVLQGSQLRLYYSGGDTVICTATVDLETVFNS